MNAFAKAAVVAGVLAPWPASAQDTSTVEAATRTMFNMAYCAVRDDGAEARKLFTTVPGSKEEAKLIGALSQQCFGFLSPAQLPEIDSQLMRGAVAEAVLDDARAKKGRLDPAAAPFGPDAVNALEAKSKASLAGLYFAQCVVVASPDGVKALLATNPTRGTQDKELAKLQPYLGPCLPKGAEVSLSKLTLRGLLAEAAYRSFYFSTAAGQK